MHRVETIALDMESGKISNGDLKQINFKRNYTATDNRNLFYFLPVFVAAGFSASADLVCTTIMYHFTWILSQLAAYSFQCE